MKMTATHLRRMGWVAVLAICFIAFLILSFKVNSVNSEVALAERQIIALERETNMLETEFQTRASQRQLANWNAVEFGYAAPVADQYLENERQLANLGSPARPDAPAPIRVAHAPGEGGDEAASLAMVSPLTGQPVTFAAVDTDPQLSDTFADLIAEASPIRSASAAEVSE